MFTLKRFLLGKISSACVAFSLVLIPARSHAQPTPVISSFSPNSGIVGASISISGTNFSATVSSNIVYFGAVQATVSSASVTNLTVTVPVGATFAPITETVGGLTAFANKPFLPTFSGDGSGISASSFAARQDLASGSGPIKVVIADLDGDGKPDLIVANVYDTSISLYRNISTNGSLTAASFAPRVDLATPAGNYTPDSILVADVDGDGKPDIIAADYGSNMISVYRNTCTPGNISSNLFAPRVDFATGAQPQGIAFMDVDGDGRPDLLTANSGDGTLSILRNTGMVGTLTTNSFAQKIDIATGNGCADVVVGDLDGDGKPDVATANNGNGTVSLLRNIGSPGDITTNSFAPKIDIAVVSGPVQMAIGDLDGDGKVDLAVASYLPQIVSVLRNTSTVGSLTTNSFASRIDYPLGGRGHTPAIADLDGDGKSDLAVVTELDSLLSIFRNVSTPGSFTNSSLANRVDFSTGYNAWGVAIGDLDGDGRPDVVFANSYDSTISLYQNQTPFGGPLPPSITTQPSNQTALTNSTVTFTVIAGGSQPLSYQWYSNSVPLLDNGHFTGSSTGTLTISNVQPADATGYTVVITNLYGSITSSVASLLIVVVPPAFTLQPQSQTVIAGTNIVFMAAITGDAPLNFQWYFNGSPLTDGLRISGSANTNLSISNVQASDAGNYTLTVSNLAGSVASTTAVLTVLVPPSITSQPIGRSVPPGLPTTITATAAGSQLNLQWQLNGTNIPNATNASYSINAVGTNDLGFYHLVASNVLSVAVSADAQLTFGPVAAWGRNLANESLPPPGLSNVVAVAGAMSASFAVRTDGTIAAWGSGFTNIPVSASNVVAISSYSVFANYALRSDGTVVSWSGLVAPGLSNIVSVAAGNGFGYALRAEGTLTNWGSPLIPSFPAGLNHMTAIACGFNNALALRNDGTVVVSGGGPVTNIPGGLNNVVAVAVGYTYAMALKSNGVVVAWGSGTGTNLPTGMTNIIAISAGNQSFENFGVAIRSDGKVMVWGDNTFAETNPPAALTNLVSIAGAAAAYHGLALVNDGSPVIIQPPIGLTAYTGRDVTLRGVAAGSAPLSYQWLLNGTNIPNATNTSLALANIQFANAGNYQLFVSNSISTAISLPAPVTVISNNTLVILSQITAAPTNLYQGGKFTLGGITVLGSGPLRYQWFFSRTNTNYLAVPAATNDTLTMDPALAINTGNYYIAVSNLVGGITSAPVNVRVLFAKAWGYLATDPPINVTNAVAIAVGNAGQGTPFGHYLALRADGKISSWSGGFVSFGETNVIPLSNSIVTAIAAGFQDSLALKSDGTVYAFGDNAFFETNVPSGLNSVTAIACGDYHDLALKSDGTITGWGQNSFLQLSNAAATNVVAIAAGGLDSMALRADGSVVDWGSTPTPIPFGTSNVIAVAAGGSHYLALRANGTVVGWGNNSFGQTTIPASLSNVVAISAGATHSTFLRNDGTVMTLGAYNGSTLITAPADLANVIAIASSADHDTALFGTRAPAFTVQPWNRTIIFNTTTNILLAAKCAGVQPVRYQWLLNGTNLPGATNDTLTLTNQPLPIPQIRLITPGAYQLVASNAYGVVTSKSAKVSVIIPLGDALDATNLNWTSTGSAQWFGETTVTHDGVDAARSSGIGALQETILQTTVGTNWPGRYTFWWKVSSEQFFDILEFRVNGTVQASISGEVDWQQASIPVAAGTNVLQWRYSKDSSFDAGQDAAWLDQFVFVPDPPVINIQPQPASQTVNMGANVSFSASAVGALKLKYQWRQNDNVVGGNSSTLALNNVGRAQNGTYFVTVTNGGGSTVSSNVVLKVLVPQLLGSPALLPDGTLTFTSTDANGGLLSPSDLANFEAQASTNLVDWLTLPNALSLTNGMLQLQDSGQSNYDARYYRLIEH